MSAEEQDDLPKGYDIQSWTKPDEYIVYQEMGTCKCCGVHTGYQKAISRGHKTWAEAREWLRRERRV